MQMACKHGNEWEDRTVFTTCTRRHAIYCRAIDRQRSVAGRWWVTHLLVEHRGPNARLYRVRLRRTHEVR